MFFGELRGSQRDTKPSSAGIGVPISKRRYESFATGSFPRFRAPRELRPIWVVMNEMVMAGFLLVMILTKTDQVEPLR